MAVRSLHHVQVLCPAGGEKAARGFYGSLLGLREISKPAALARDGVWFELDDARQVHVGVARAADQPTRNRSHLAIQVDDLDRLVSRLRQRDVLVSEPPPVQGWKRVQVRDPFGNGVELLQIVAEGRSL
jgi:catechol 2,3-dioxygenase-like lactoylglutathione lyase family enzyme